MSLPGAPFHPIIYVRGFAATQSEIEETVADPYMGFNIGSTKSRKEWTGEVRKYFFESPLIRLMGDYGYEDFYEDGADLLYGSGRVSYRSVVIYRYYDEASKDFGNGKGTPPILRFAEGLSDLILLLKERMCEAPNFLVPPQEFRVHLVAHSMGGLVCRAFLQNLRIGDQAARNAVDKVFTYATPHNGIDMRIVRNIPGWLSFGDVNNFNRQKMAQYLDIPRGEDVSRVTNFPAERIFNLVGTNSRDYAVAGGLSAWAAGDESDGLVRIENATTYSLDAVGNHLRSPRAYVHRSHSGPYGIVNSEEGYQNLCRFLFGTLRVDGILEIDEISLPVEVRDALEQRKRIHASYQFEVVASIRGFHWQITRREQREHSAIFRTYDELFPEVADSRQPDRRRSPHLFSIFLEPSKSVKANKSVSFAFDLKVLVPDYVVDGAMFLKRHFEGGYIFRDLVIVEAFADENAPGGMRIKYGFQDINPGKAGIDVETLPLSSLRDGRGPDNARFFYIPITKRANPGLTGRLRIEVTPVAVDRRVA